MHTYIVKAKQPNGYWKTIAECGHLAAAKRVQKRFVRNKFQATIQKVEWK
jgi:hypothetical protein